jgi:predicted O-methyltransferase YrrM
MSPGELAAAGLRRIALQALGFRSPARHSELSVVISLDDDPGQPTAALIQVALSAVHAALELDLSDLKDRSPAAAQFVNRYPGEHYRLLAGLVRSLGVKSVVEVGTYTGLSALALLHELAADGQVTTFDLWPWTQPERAGIHQPTALREEDFADGRLRQELGNLSDPEIYRRHEELLRQSDLIFCDGPKDGVFEPMFLGQLLKRTRQKPSLLVFDDIRTWTMLRDWRRIRVPKLDVTSFGHWTGTGLVWLPAAG